MAPNESGMLGDGLRQGFLGSGFVDFKDDDGEMNIVSVRHFLFAVVDLEMAGVSPQDACLKM